MDMILRKLLEMIWTDFTNVTKHGRYICMTFGSCQCQNIIEHCDKNSFERGLVCTFHDLVLKFALSLKPSMC